MTARLIIGKRGSDVGVFVAAPGYDAETAAPEQLLLDASQRAIQVLMRGVAVQPWPKTIVLPGTVNIPFAFLSTITIFAGIGNAGYCRPWPAYNTGVSMVAEIISPTQMKLITLRGETTSPPRVGYTLFYESL